MSRGELRVIVWQVFSLINASGGEIGDVPTGRPTEDIVGRDTGGSVKINDNNDDDKHQRHTNGNRKELRFEEHVSKELVSEAGVGSGGLGTVVSGSARRPAVVIDVVEGLSTTTTMNENDDNNNDIGNDITADAARRATITPGHVDRQKSSPLEAATNQEAGVTAICASVPAPGLVSRTSRRTQYCRVRT